MSAFLCSDKHINTLVCFASDNRLTAGYGNPTHIHVVYGAEQATAELLLAENLHSVSHRYKTEPHADDAAITYNPKTPRVTPIEILKACQCLAYQCDESPTWGRSAAKALLWRIKDKAIDLLPGYDEAPWGVE